MYELFLGYSRSSTLISLGLLAGLVACGSTDGGAGAPSLGDGGAGGAPAIVLPEACGEEVELARLPALPVAVALDATSVYFNAWDRIAQSTTVNRVSRDGTGLEELYASEKVGVLAVDATSVYFSTGAAVMKMPLRGGDPVVLWPGAAGEAVALDSTSVYFVAGDEGSIAKVPKAGGQAVFLVQDVEASAIAVDATSLYFTTREEVGKVPLQGGKPVTLAANQHNPGKLAVNRTDVYYLTVPGVMKVPVEGGEATVVAADQDGPCDLVLADEHVYFSTSCAPPIFEDHSSLKRVPLTAGAPVESCAWSPKELLTGFAIDGKTVFFLHFDRRGGDGYVLGGTLE